MPRRLFRSVVGVLVGLALEVPATSRVGFERFAEPAGIPAGGVARNRRSTQICIRSADRRTTGADSRRCVMSVMIGIDPHKGSHAAAAVDAGEVMVAEIEVIASRHQTEELLAWAEQFPVRRWAIENANDHGYLLAQQLITAREHVVDVPSMLSARVRVLDSTRSQTNDPNDARSVAIVALRHPPLRRSQRPSRRPPRWPRSTKVTWSGGVDLGIGG